MDLQAEGFGAAGNRLPNAAHADNAEPLASETAAHHPCRSPTIKLTGFHQFDAFM